MWYSKKTKKKVIGFVSGWDNKPRKAYDDLLVPYEIRVNQVYSKELYKKKLISREEYTASQDGLDKLLVEYYKGRLNVKYYEDVHSLVEAKLSELGNLYLGKSRNDQICTIMKMWERERVADIKGGLENLTLVIQSEIMKKGQLIIPGYSHHRIAMPTTYGQLLDSYLIQLRRDERRLYNWIELHNECPLGAGAGFGSQLKLNMSRIAKDLGFARVSPNSIDAVDRGEAEADLVFTSLTLLNHLSKLAQDFIYLSSAGIDVLSLPKEYCTGSSIMPQKRNPDVLEIIKAKAAKAQGSLVSLLSIGKGNISGYNRDSQWTKYIIMDLMEEFEGLFDVLPGLISGIEINEKRSKELLKKENAYSAEKVIKKCIKEKKSFRKEKLKVEERIKKRR